MKHDKLTVSTKYRMIPVRKGIANRFPGNYIEYHEKLLEKQYQPLLFEIVSHELHHTPQLWNINDLILDLKGFSHRWLYWKFVLSTPSSWWQFLPWYKSRKKWYLDINITIVYLTTLILLIAIWTFIK